MTIVSNPNTSHRVPWCQNCDRVSDLRNMQCQHWQGQQWDNFQYWINYTPLIPNPHIQTHHSRDNTSETSTLQGSNSLPTVTFTLHRPYQYSQHQFGASHQNIWLSEPMVQMVFQQMQANQKLIQIIPSNQSSTPSPGHTETPRANIDIPKWEKNRIQRLQFKSGHLHHQRLPTAGTKTHYWPNLLSLLNTTTLIYHENLPSNVIETLSKKSAYYEKGIQMWD